jgi:hypothetical protein
MFVEETEGSEDIVDCTRKRSVGQDISILADKGSCGSGTVGGEMVTYTS